LKDAFELNSNIDCDIDTSLTSIEALHLELGTIGKEVSIALNKKDVESRLKRMAKRKLLNCSKRPPTDGERHSIPLNKRDIEPRLK